MKNGYRSLSGSRFIRKILDNKRDFSGIELERGCNLNSYNRSEEMRDYLKSHRKKFEQNPINISYSKFKDITAEDLFFPFIKANETKLIGGKYSGTQFPGGEFNSAYLVGGEFYKTNFWGAKFLGKTIFYQPKLVGAEFLMADIDAFFVDADATEAYFWKAWLNNSEFSAINIKRADFTKADITGLKKLEEAYNIHTAIFTNAITAEQQKKLIEERTHRTIS